MSEIITKRINQCSGKNWWAFTSISHSNNELRLANASFEFKHVGWKRKAPDLFTMGFGWAGYSRGAVVFQQTQGGKLEIMESLLALFPCISRFQKPKHSVFFQVGFTSTTLLAFASDDLVEMALGMPSYTEMDLIFGEKPSFTVPFHSGNWLFILVVDYLRKKVLKRR